jgi:hypothetical protein
MVLIIGHFSLFHLVDDGINCRLLKRLVPIHSLRSQVSLISKQPLPALGEVGDKVPYACHSTGREGWQGITVFGRPGRKKS